MEIDFSKINYIELVKKVDLFLVVFVLVNIIGKLVYGIVDDLLLIVVLVFYFEILKIIVFVMNMYMY